MEIKLDIKNRRLGVLANLGSLIFLVGIFELFTIQKISESLILWISLGIILSIFIISFIKVFGQTGIWRLIHSSLEKLDERQVMIISKAIRISYSIFTIATLSIIYGFALIKKEPIDLVTAASLLYLAHILPGTILAWMEKII